GADRIQKGRGQPTGIENGGFTSCHCADRAPDRSLGGQELELKAGSYGKLKAGTFNVLDVPILYVPRALIPANRDRASGLLIPRVGVSNLRGFQMVTPYYWAISKSQDATVGFDIETSQRGGFPVEYRYIFGRRL